MKGLISGLLRFSIGALIGYGVGVALATALAPSSGEDLRQGVRRRVAAVRQAGEHAESETTDALRRSYRVRVGTNHD